MVWKFNSPAAEAKHFERLQRSEPLAGMPVLTEVVPVLTDVVLPLPPSKVSTFSGYATRPAEPTLLEALPSEHGHRVSFGATKTASRIELEPPTVESDVTSVDVTLWSAQVRESFSQVLPDPPALIVLELEDFPASDLSWDIPPFEGTPDELPDLRPAPPARIEHPGLQFRSVNTFGHAPRMPAEDERQQLWLEQRRDRGFDDTELWGLDDAFARFILPRLKALRQQKLEAPHKRMELTVWYSLLDKMIRAFELLLPEGGGAWSRGTLNDRERAQVQEGLDLFRKYYFSLSW
jgi:hypothetical protein